MVADTFITRNPPRPTFPDHITKEGEPIYVSDNCEVEPEPFTQVMVDIETMSLHRHKAVILSVGMVEFDPTPLEGPRFGRERLLIPDLTHQLLLGRHVMASTQEFWRKQPLAAAEHWLAPHTYDTLSQTINVIRDFCSPMEHVWANGTQFDLSNLDGLAEDIGDTKELWSYRAPSDMRTLRKHFPATRIKAEENRGLTGVLHEPVYDCKSQAWEVWTRQQ